MTEEIDLEKGILTRPLTRDEKAIEALARFMVDELGLMGPSPDGERRSGGHKWNRSHAEDREFFRGLARSKWRDIQHEAARRYDRGR